jgi:hypothetical protein
MSASDGGRIVGHHEENQTPEPCDPSAHDAESCIDTKEGEKLLDVADAKLRVAHANVGRKQKEDDTDASGDEEDDDDEEENRQPSQEEMEASDPVVIAQMELIRKSKPTTELEIAYFETLQRKEAHIERLTVECNKMKLFVRKRKQTYKRKRKEEGAPRRALSGYNLFIKERFEALHRENEEALKSDDKDATLKRVPPANLVTKTGNEWKALPPEVKAQYDER